MNLQITPTRIVPNAITVWPEHGPEVDIVMDLKKLTFAPGSIGTIFAFHVLDHVFPNEVMPMLKNWRQCLKPKGVLFVVVDDFEYIARSFVGGDLLIDVLNENYNHPMQFTKDNLVRAVSETGFNTTNMRIWYADVEGQFKRLPHELVISADNV